MTRGSKRARLAGNLSALTAVAVVSAGSAAGASVATHHAQHGAPQARRTASRPPAPIYVPNLVGSAFVFAKVALSDSGLNWRVCGSVEGYSSNIVVRQLPAAGEAVDGAAPPVVRVWLRRNDEYPQLGAPDEASAAPAAC